MTKQRLVLLGKPNVGKSSLINKLVPRIERSVVSSTEGTTVDYREVSSKWGWRIVDTPGILAFERPRWWFLMQESDLCVWVTDKNSCFDQLDCYIADLVRSVGGVVCANKCDQRCERVESVMGLECLEVSAYTCAGIDDLVSYANDSLDTHRRSTQTTNCDYMIVGQPNAGKSSIANALHGSGAVNVSAVAGSTVDAVTLKSSIGDIQDTPGMKRRAYKSFMSQSIESVERKLKLFKGIVMLVIDITEELVSQDLRMGAMIWRSGNPVLVLLNKCDLVQGKISPQWRARISVAIPGAKTLRVSAKNRTNLGQVSTQCRQLHTKWHERVSTGRLNRWCRGVLAKISYISQVDVAPPKLFIAGKDITESDYRLIARKFREDFGFGSVPIKINSRTF